MSSNIHTRAQTLEPLRPSPAHQKQANTTQNLSRSHTHHERVNQLSQMLELLTPLLSKLLQESLHDNKALRQINLEDNSTQSSEGSSESEASEEVSENEDNSEIEDGSERDEGEEGDDEENDHNKENHTMSKCSKIFDRDGCKFTVVEYFKGACPVGWDAVK